MTVQIRNPFSPLRRKSAKVKRAFSADPESRDMPESAKGPKYTPIHRSGATKDSPNRQTGKTAQKGLKTDPKKDPFLDPKKGS